MYEIPMSGKIKCLTDSQLAVAEVFWLALVVDGFRMREM